MKIFPFYGELSAEEAELLKVPHGTPVKIVKTLRKARRIMRLAFRIATAVAIAIAIATAVVVLI